MHSGKEMKDGIGVNPDESKIQSARRVMNAFLMHESGLYIVF